VTFTDAALSQAEREHCLRMVAAGPAWDAYALDKARSLGKRRVYAELPAAVEGAILEAGRNLPPAWIEPAGTEAFQIPPRYRMATQPEKAKR
jgi:hypothetical protein